MSHNLEEQKLHRCALCGVTFRKKFNLLIHEKRHTGEKPYKCEVCGATFPRKGSLQRHLRTHTGEKVHSCTSCDKTFAYKSSLVQHYKWHAGEKPYECNDCGKTFTRKNTLIQHIPLHTGEKPFKCNYCNSVFSRKVRLLHHIWQHNGDWPYKCSYCDKGFPDRNALVTHQRIHTGERPYKCNVCNKGYTSRSNLGRHLRCHNNSQDEYTTSSSSPIPAENNLTHREDEKLMCHICPHQFASRRELANHMKSHTQGKRFGAESEKTSGIPGSFFNEDTTDSQTTGENDRLTEQLRTSTILKEDHALECKLKRLSVAPDDRKATDTSSYQRKASSKRYHPRQPSISHISSSTPPLRRRDLPPSNQRAKEVTAAEERGELGDHRKPRDMQGPVRRSRDTLAAHASKTERTLVFDVRTDCLTKAECDRILFSSGTVRIRSPSPCENCAFTTRNDHLSLDSDRENTDGETDHTLNNLANIDDVQRLENNAVVQMGSPSTTEAKGGRYLAVKKEKANVDQYFGHHDYYPSVKEEIEFTEFTDDTF
ncbi:zinc finger protein 605-like [Penaeus chinensis]|uniref:zinc finger protein 605-like n=1 Tax=Penaeus chinensis TaxID=139456 RepID=UPI001FB6739F|nr:zinc finger protein 605-like [Penaeus chinensis]